MPPQLSVGLAARDGAPDLSAFARSLDELADLDLGHVEIPAFAYDLALAGRPLARRIDELVAACRDRPHRFTVHGPLATNFMAPVAVLPRFLDVTAVFVEICARIGAPHLVVHAGMLLPEERHDFDGACARQRDWLGRAGDIAAAHGVMLCIENLFDFGPYVATPSIARLAAEIASLDHASVRATFDFSHGLIHATHQGYDFLAQAEALAPLAAHLHLHDSFGLPAMPWVYADAEANAFGAGDLHLPLGWGAVPWQAIAARCRFPDRVIAIHELNPRFWRDRREALAASRAFADTLEATAC